MTEYDYSPEGYARARATQDRIRNWRDQAQQNAPYYGNPFMLTPSQAAEIRAASPASSDSSLADSTDEYYGRKSRGREHRHGSRHRHHDQQQRHGTRSKTPQAQHHGRSRSLSYSAPQYAQQQRPGIYAHPPPPPPPLPRNAQRYKSPTRSFTANSYPPPQPQQTQPMYGPPSSGHTSPIYASSPQNYSPTHPPYGHHAGGPPQAGHHIGSGQQFPPHLRPIQPHRSNSVPAGAPPMHAGRGQAHQQARYPQPGHAAAPGGPVIVIPGSRNGIQVLSYPGQGQPQHPMGLHQPQPRYPYPTTTKQQQPWFKRILGMGGGGGGPNSASSRKSSRSRRQSY